MSGQLGVCDGSASGIEGANKPHPHWPECKNWRPIEPPTELTSLREIKDKLDALAESQKRIEEQLLTKAAASQLHVVAESQVLITGFLKGWQPKIDEQFAGLHETAMRNHQQVLTVLGIMPAEVFKQFQRNITPQDVELIKPPRKASKKARRR